MNKSLLLIIIVIDSKKVVIAVKLLLQDLMLKCKMNVGMCQDQ